MAPRPPADGVVALRSLPRRFRGLFAGLHDDESPDALATRPGADGQSADDHIADATAALVRGAIDLGVALGGAGDVRGWVGSTVGDRLDELARVAGELADRAEHVTADEWTQPGATTALWTAVDTAVEHLKGAERTLAEVRGRP